MEPSLQRRIQRYGWDRAADFYETSWQEQLKPAQDCLLDLAKIEDGERVIDIACGTGLVSFRALEMAGPKGKVLGTDLSDKMVESSKALASELGFTNIDFERMDAEELTVNDSVYDVALDALGLMYVPDPVKALKEMYRVLVPGGRAVAAVWGQRKNCGWADIFEIVDKRVSSEVCPMFFQSGNPGMLEMQFKAAGFTNLKSETLNTILSYESGEQACEAAFAGGPVALAFHKFTPEVKSEVFDEYLQSIAPYRNKNRYEIPGEFVVVMGRKP